MRNLISLVLIFCFFSTSLIAKEVGRLLVRNYHPREYKAFSQNWDIVIDKNDVLYFANGDGVLQYNGTNWNLITLPENNTVTSLLVDQNNRVYVGGISEFGYLHKDKKGSIIYRSLLSLIPASDRLFSFVSNMFEHQGGIYFTTPNKLFCYKNGKVKSWNIVLDNTLMKVGNRLVLWQKQKGFFEVNGNHLYLSSPDIQIGTNIINMFPYKGKYLIVTARDGIFEVSEMFNGGNKPLKYKKVEGPVSRLLKDLNILKTICFDNGTFAFLTLKNGTLILDKNLELIQLINKKNGVVNETHNEIYKDKQGGYWLALDVGIAKVEAAYPVYFWNDLLGIQGSVMDVCRFNDKVYAASWQGLFYTESDIAIEDNQINKFKSVRHIQMQCWDLLENKTYNELIVASGDGLFVVDQKHNIKNIDKEVYHKLVIPKFNKDILFAVKSNGVQVFCRKQGAYVKNTNMLYNFSAIKDVKADEFGNVWILYNNTKLAVVSPSPNLVVDCNTLIFNQSGLKWNYFFHEKTLKFKKEDERIKKLMNINNQMYAISVSAIYKVVLKNGNIEVAETKTLIPKDILKNYDVVSVGVDKAGNMWGQANVKNQKTKFLFEAKKNKEGIYQFDFNKLKPIPSMDIHSVVVEDNGLVWFCGDDGLYRYQSNNKFNYNVGFKVVINEIQSLKEDSVYYEGIDVGGDSINRYFEFENNSLRFSYSALYYFNENRVQYSYQLSGFDKDWSEWTTVSSKEYTNLPYGKYVFKVKARNVFGTVSKVATYQFEIAHPWYFSPWAYSMYVVILLVLLYLGVLLFNRRLLSTKLRLESIVRDRTLELINRQKQIEEEKEKSDRLLLNILPIKIASELKKNGYAKTQYYAQTTVLFADFRGFTYISQVLEPQHLIKELDKRFVFFDDVCLRYNIEKIKTIGDAYMCVGGIPNENTTHAVDMILAAFEMQAYMKKLADETTEGHIWELRIGIHTGSLIAGVVGKNKFAYDVWGDTVNTASRVEASGHPGKINISGETYEQIKEFFECTYRGKHPVKNRGEIDMYFVDRIRKELSNDEIGVSYNRMFKEKYDLLKNKQS